PTLIGCVRDITIPIREVGLSGASDRRLREAHTSSGFGREETVLMQLTLNINGKSERVDVEPETPLLWVLRDTIGLTGTKYGCGIARCGACTIHVDGQAMKACQLPASVAAGKQITTIEGLSKDSSHPVQKAWVEIG